MMIKYFYKKLTLKLCTIFQIYKKNYSTQAELANPLLEDARAYFLSQPQLNLKSTEKLGVSRKWIYSTHHHHHTPPHKLNVIHISAVPALILTKL